MESFEMLRGSEEQENSLNKELFLLSSENTFEEDEKLRTMDIKRKAMEDNMEDKLSVIEVCQNNHEEENANVSKMSTKRRRKQQECIPFYLLSEIFLRIVYPLSVYVNKNVTVGFCKFLDYAPGVLLSHGGKQITFAEDSWKSFSRSIPLIHCYLINKVYGKKTSISIESSDVEIDNIKVRGELLVRVRNLSSHDNKVLLNRNELEIFINALPAIDRYIQQLETSRTTIKDYLINTIESGQDCPLFYNPIDSSIYNRLPQEVYLFRTFKSLQSQNEPIEQETKYEFVEDEPLIKFKFEKNDEALDLSNE